MLTSSALIMASHPLTPQNTTRSTHCAARAHQRAHHLEHVAAQQLARALRVAAQQHQQARSLRARARAMARATPPAVTAGAAGLRTLAATLKLISKGACYVPTGHNLPMHTHQLHRNTKPVLLRKKNPRP